jgi:hypothetical protein
MSTNGVIPPEEEGTSTEQKEGAEVAPESTPAPEPKPASEASPEPEAAPVVPQTSTEAVAVLSGEPSAQSLIDEYRNVVKWNSLIRVIFPVFVLALIIVFIMVTIAGVMSAFPEKRITQETVKAGEELIPILNSALRSFVDDVAPQLADEFQRGLDEGGEQLATMLAMELERLESSAADRVKQRVHIAIEKEKAAHRKLLKEKFAEADAGTLEQMTVRVNKAFEMWTVKYMLGILEDYYLAMAKINDTVIRGYRQPVKEGQPKVQEAEMLELFMELVNAAYTEGEPGQEAAVEGTPPVKDDAPVTETVPAEGEEAAPAEGDEAVPAEGEEAAPAEGAKAAPAEADESTNLETE